jgi:hypothetical protein
MSRSYREPHIRDRPRNDKKVSMYWRPVRSRINQLVRMGKDEELPDPKTIINDYDISDYNFYHDTPKNRRK